MTMDRNASRYTSRNGVTLRVTLVWSGLVWKTRYEQ